LLALLSAAAIFGVVGIGIARLLGGEQTVMLKIFAVSFDRTGDTILNQKGQLTTSLN
jgi:hypothetical protein